ncbi:unnamed protein product [Musa hybrid cultivar]
MPMVFRSSFLSLAPFLFFFHILIVCSSVGGCSVSEHKQVLGRWLFLSIGVGV